MEVPKIFESEYRFCLILWEHEPINSTNRAHFAACPVAFGEVSVKERIKSVLSYKKPGF